MGHVVLPFACEAAVCCAVDVGAVVPPFWVCVTTTPIRTVLHRLSPLKRTLGAKEFEDCVRQPSTLIV